jgi:hypothetical protein
VNADEEFGDRGEAEALQAAGVHDECPRCGGMKWLRMPGYLQLILSNQPAPTTSIFDGFNALPCVAWVCGQCGFLSTHLYQELMGLGDGDPK